MLYDPIQGQGQGHEPLKVGNSAIFKGYLLSSFIIMGAGKWPRILKVDNVSTDIGRRAVPLLSRVEAKVTTLCHINSA